MAEFTKEQLIEQAVTIRKSAMEMADWDGRSGERARAALSVIEIALAVLTAEPEEYIFDHPHGKLFRSISDKSNAGMPGVFPVYRLPLLEGLK